MSKDNKLKDALQALQSSCRKQIKEIDLIIKLVDDNCNNCDKSKDSQKLGLWKKFLSNTLRFETY